MRKILSLICFAVALIATWSLIHSAPSSGVGFETHSGIQQKLADMILETLKSKKPEAQDVRITRLWTENVDQNKVRAVFAYRFTEKAEDGEKTEQTTEGEAILHREPSDDARLDKWVLQKVQTTGDSLNFSEGSIITPTPGADEEVPAGSETPATPSTPEKSGH